jgi:dephospho-CoA kinase
MMLKVGLTGNIGSGKTTVARVFGSLGIPVFHADDEAKAMYAIPEVAEEVRKLFGDGVFHPDGQLDLKELAAIVFSQKTELVKLNRLIHPLVRKHFSEWARQEHHAPYLLYEAAILVETGFHKFTDRMIVVTAPEDVRIRRVMERDGLSREQVMARIRNQMEETMKSEMADYIINNDDESMLMPQILDIHRHLIQLNR